MASGTQKFSATVFKIDINPYVDIPDRVTAELLRQAKKAKGPVPVKGPLNGAPFQTNAVKFRGAWRLYLNLETRRAADVDVGDKVDVEIAFDRNPPQHPIPEKLAIALAKNKKAKTAFEKLSTSHQKEIIRYLTEIKRSAGEEHRKDVPPAPQN